MKAKISLKDLESPSLDVDRDGHVVERASGKVIGELRVTQEQLASLLTFKAIQKAKGTDAGVPK